jgi:hypothetical protein
MQHLVAGIQYPGRCGSSGFSAGGASDTLCRTTLHCAISTGHVRYRRRVRQYPLFRECLRRTSCNRTKSSRESFVLLKNDGSLPFGTSQRAIAVVGPTADLLVSLEGNYNGAAVHPVSPLDGIEKQFPNAAIHYAQGATLANGVGVPVPRTALEKASRLSSSQQQTGPDGPWPLRPIPRFNTIGVIRRPAPKSRPMTTPYVGAAEFRCPHPVNTNSLWKAARTFPIRRKKATALSSMENL